MAAPLRIRQIEIHRLAIPLRLKFEHAAASRAVADPLILALHAQGPPLGLVGYGETVARPYVTGETAESAARDMADLFAPLLAGMRVHGFSEALEFAETLPFAAVSPSTAPPRCIQAARAAVELAIIDLAGTTFGRRAADVSDWIGRSTTTSIAPRPYSGIVAGGGWKGALLLRLQRLYGLRDFKIKLAVDGWEDRLQRAVRMLRAPLASGAATLRGDANGGWSPDQTLAAAPLLVQSGVSVLEQPIAPATLAQRAAGPARSGFADIADRLAAAGFREGRSRLELMCDESLVTLADARQMLVEQAVDIFNVRIAKQGGLLAALRVAHEIQAAGRDVQLGCMVGETSVLSAAGSAFAEVFPRLRFREGAFGRRLLAEDVSRTPVQFRFGGSLSPLGATGLGVEVDPAALARLAQRPAHRIVL